MPKRSWRMERAMRRLVLADGSMHCLEARIEASEEESALMYKIVRASSARTRTICADLRTLKSRVGRLNSAGVCCREVVIVPTTIGTICLVDSIF